MAEPVRAIQAAEPIRLDINNISFKEGKLWQPRYETLIDYSHVPEGFQFEPAFEVVSKESDQEIQVVFRIADTENVEFDPDGKWDYLALAGTPQVSVTLLSPRSCQVDWTRSGDQSSLMSLRIACRHPGVEPTDALDRIEGGVYLVIIDPGPSSTDPVQAPPRSNLVGAAAPGGAPVPAGGLPAGIPPKAGTIRLLKFDEHSRPVYNLFCGDVPRELVQEPAFRVAHEQQFDLTIALDPPEAHFQVDAEGKPVLSFFIPGTFHVSLVGTTVDTNRKACTIQWHRPIKQSNEDRTKGTTIFNLNLDPVNGRPVKIDPTVIEPPACDANGVCSPPRNWGQGRVSAG